MCLIVQFSTIQRISIGIRSVGLHILSYTYFMKEKLFYEYIMKINLPIYDYRNYY